MDCYAAWVGPDVMIREEFLVPVWPDAPDFFFVEAEVEGFVEVDADVPPLSFDF